MTADPEQSAWQRRAVRVLASLLEQGARENLPVLGWTVSPTGAALTGRSSVTSAAGRKTDLAAWANVLGIELKRPFPNLLTGIAKQRDTPHGLCTIVLTADIWPDDDDPEAVAGPEGDDKECE